MRPSALQGGEASGKHAPHSFAKAQPWTKFRGKQVGRKEVALKNVHRPGHKANAVLEEPTASSAIGAYWGVERAPVVNTMRRQFGAFGHEARETDALGPVDHNAERAAIEYHNNFMAQQMPAAPRRGRLNTDPPPDTLRWNGDESQGGRGSLAAAARRKAAEAAAEEEAKAAADRRKAESMLNAKLAAGGEGAGAVHPAVLARGKGDVAEPIGRENVGRSERALRHEEQVRVRHQLEEQKRAEAAQLAAGRAAAAARGGAPEFYHPLLADKAKVAALTNPKVTAALHAKLNEPNKLAFDQIKQRNTERVSAERKY